MKSYVVLIRGVNVGGKNKVSMAALRECLEELGFSKVSTYIASGNILLQSDKEPGEIKESIEAALPQHFALDTELIKVLVLSKEQLKAVIDHRPKGFGDKPDTYHSDAIFLIDVSIDEVMPVFNPREGVDAVWPGSGVVYSQRLSAERTKSRLSVIVASPLYKSMTIRSWNTTTKLYSLLDALENSN
jgi:uncharacterized protein (DUF1697 family)